jgi:hypothetical protein
MKNTNKIGEKSEKVEDGSGCIQGPGCISQYRKGGCAKVKNDNKIGKK